MVFMPVILGAFADMSKEDIDNIGLIYEYMDKAGPRSINGMPIFMTCRTIKKTESDKMFEYFKQYQELKEKFKTT